MTTRPVESDVPKALPFEAGRFLATPGWPPLAIENPRLVGTTLLFDLMNRLPVPLFVAVAARFPLTNGEELWSEAVLEFIGPLSRDEWKIEVPRGARRADVRVGLFPLEIALARRVVEL